MFGKVRKPDVEAFATLMRVALPLLGGMTDKELHERITGNRRLAERLRTAFDLAPNPEITLVNRVWLIAEHARCTTDCLGAAFQEWNQVGFYKPLPVGQMGTSETSVSIYRNDNPQTLLSMCKMALQLPLSARADEVIRHLKSRRHLLTLQQINQMVVRQMRFNSGDTESKDLALRVSEWPGNYFPTEDDLGLVTFVEVYKDEDNSSEKVSCRLRDLSYVHDLDLGTRLILNDSPVVIKQ